MMVRLGPKALNISIFEITILGSIPGQVAPKAAPCGESCVSARRAAFAMRAAA